MKEQANNTRFNVIVTIGDESKTMAEWCDQYGVSQQHIDYRVNNMGMTYEQAFNFPKGLYNRGKD